MQKCNNSQKNIGGKKKSVSVYGGVSYIPSPNQHWLFSLYLQQKENMELTNHPLYLYKPKMYGRKK